MKGELYQIWLLRTAIGRYHQAKPVLKRVWGIHKLFEVGLWLLWDLTHQKAILHLLLLPASATLETLNYMTCLKPIPTSRIQHLIQAGEWLSSPIQGASLHPHCYAEFQVSLGACQQAKQLWLLERVLTTDLENTVQLLFKRASDFSTYRAQFCLLNTMAVLLLTSTR